MLQCKYHRWGISVQLEKRKKKKEWMFILFARHSRSPRIGRNQHYTIDINQVLRRASIACVCMFSHTHSHTQFLVYPSAATDNYTFNSFGENQRKLGSPFFYFIFSTQTQHEKCFIKVQNTFESFTISYITWVRKQLPPPPSSRRQKKKKKKKSTIRVDAEPVSRQFKAHDTKLTNHTFVLLQNNRK